MGRFCWVANGGCRAAAKGNTPARSAKAEAHRIRRRAPTTCAMWSPAVLPGPGSGGTGPGSPGAVHGGPMGGGGANAPVYDAQALRADLLAIPLAEKTVETLEMDVRTICLNHGVGLARDRIERAPNGGRLKGVRLKCSHWIKKKQAEGRPSGPSGLPNRQGLAKRTGCKFIVHIRWPVDDDEHPHPRLTTLSLFHDHDIDVLQVRATTTLHVPAAAVNKKPEARTTPAPQSRFGNAGQGGGAVQGGQEIDTNALYQQVLKATGGHGVCKVELDAQRPHSFRVTKDQRGSAPKGSIEAIKRMTAGNLLRGLEALGVEAATELRASTAELKQQASIAVALRGSLGEAQKEAGGADVDGREAFETILAAATREVDEPLKLSAKRTAEILHVSEQAVSQARERAKRMKNDDAVYSA